MPCSPGEGRLGGVGACRGQPGSLVGQVHGVASDGLQSRRRRGTGRAAASQGAGVLPDGGGTAPARSGAGGHRRHSTRVLRSISAALLGLLTPDYDPPSKDRARKMLEALADDVSQAVDARLASAGPWRIVSDGARSKSHPFVNARHLAGGWASLGSFVCVFAAFRAAFSQRSESEFRQAAGRPSNRGRRLRLRPRTHVCVHVAGHAC